VTNFIEDLLDWG